MRITQHSVQLLKVVAAASLALWLSLALVSYCPTDHSVMYDTSYVMRTHNYMGSYGAHVAGLLLYILGAAAWLLPCLCLFISFIYLRRACLFSVVCISNISIACVLLLVSMLVCAYVQLYPGAFGLYILEYLSYILESWLIVLFLYSLLWSLSVLCIFRPLCRLLVRARMSLVTHKYCRAYFSKTVNQNRPKQHIKQ